jgi:hypothetical protein
MSSTTESQGMEGMSLRWGTRDWYLMNYSSHFVTGGQKHTHTHTPLGWLDHHLTLLTHGGSAAARTLNLVSRYPAKPPSPPLAIFPLRLVMGGATAVRSLGHLHCPHLQPAISLLLIPKSSSGVVPTPWTSTHPIGVAPHGAMPPFPRPAGSQSLRASPATHQHSPLLPWLERILGPPRCLQLCLQLVLPHSLLTALPSHQSRRQTIISPHGI